MANIKVENIVIVGGGTAGWVIDNSNTSNNFYKNHLNNLDEYKRVRI